MKKLMTMIAVAATAFGLFADTPQKTFSTSFEENDAETQEGFATAGWTGAEDGLIKFADYASDAYVYGSDSFARRSDYFVDDTDQNKYVALETGTNEVKHAVNDTFLDQLVKFTGFEDVQTNFEGDVKIAIWMRGIEAGEGEPAAGETNLYITAAMVKNEQAEPVAFKIPAPANETWKVEKWYRVTVKNIGNIYKEEIPEDAARAGFIVYIDGQQVACDEAKGIVDYVTSMDPAAAKYMAAGQLFPAIDTTDVAFNSVGYKGKGAIDDIIADANGPLFAQTIEYTFAIDVTGVDGLEVGTVVGPDGTLTPKDGKYTVADGTVVTVTYVPAEGYKAMGNMTQTVEITSADDVTPDSTIVAPAAVVATVTNGVETDEYAECELYDLFMNDGLVDGDAVTFNVGGSVTNGEGEIFYDFTANTTIGVVIADAATTWNIRVNEITKGSEGGFTDNVGVGAGNTNNITVATVDCSFTVGDDVTIAGTLKAEKLEISSTVALAGDGKILAKDGELLDSITCDEGTVVVSGPDEGGYYIYSILPPQDFGGGSGTDVDPYIISNADHLVELQTKVAAGDTFAGKFFQQTAEIDMSALEWTGIGPIATATGAFAGTYDGAGNKIDNLTFKMGNQKIALFNSINGATIKNLVVDSNGFTGTPEDAKKTEGGAILVYRTHGTCVFENVTTEGTYSSNYNPAGFVSDSYGNLTFTSCTNKATIASTYTKAAGFIAIRNAGTVSFVGCVNEGAISADNKFVNESNPSDGYASGFVAYWTNETTGGNIDVSFTNCVNTGAITASSVDTGKTGLTSAFVTQCQSNKSVTDLGGNIAAETLPAVNNIEGTLTGFTYAVPAQESGYVTYVTTLALNGSYKVMNKYAAPVFEFTEAGTIAFNTNMFFVADYTGITVDDDTKWVLTPAENAGIVTFTCTAKQTDPIPPVDPQAEPSAVSNEIDKVSYVDKAAIQAVIGGDAQKYNAFANWAKTVDGGQAAVIASSYAAKSFELAPFVDGNVLFTAEPTLTTTAIAADTETAGNWAFTVKLTDGAKGELVALLASIANCAKVSDDLATWDAATATATINKDGTATIKITPPEETDKAFMKVEVK